MNDPRKLFIDERLRNICVYCGTVPNTRDHCPSKVLLDLPYPQNLPVVEACEKCNQSFSLDEQYLACFLECAMCGSTQPEMLQREGIRRILEEMPHLAAEIQSSMAMSADGTKVWYPDMGRVTKVLLKLARGHLHYELGVQERDRPATIEVFPLALMEAGQRKRFEYPYPDSLATWPELGSRAFLRACAFGELLGDGWQYVQEGRYRYLVGQREGNYAHIVIGEYLGCRVVWN